MARAPLHAPFYTKIFKVALAGVPDDERLVKLIIAHAGVLGQRRAPGRQ
jgi:hypothetical protein